MSLVARAASLAAVSLCAGFLLGTTTPGFAQELDRSHLPTLNALALPQLQAATTEAPQDMPTLRPALVETLPETVEVTQPVVEEELDYDTLAEAVAAQTHAISDDEMRCLASGVYHESKGEPLVGQLAVAHTILNRTRSGRFPKSICSVLTQRGQFSFVRGGVVPSAEGRSGWNTAVAVAKVAHADLWDSAAANSLFFHARHVAPAWRKTRVAAIGNHVFYR